MHQGPILPHICYEGIEDRKFMGIFIRMYTESM